MGMTIDDMYDWLYRLKSELIVYIPKEWHEPMRYAIQNAIIFSRKYQLMLSDYEEQIKINNKQLRAYTTRMRAEYEKCLKADKIAMLTDIQLDVEGQKFDTHMDKDVWNDAIRVCSELIQQKINELEAESEDV